MLNDLRYALRTLWRSPGFAVSAILALALGIGANTAVFSVVYAALLKPLPYAEPERLVRLYERNPAQGIERGKVSPGTFVDWRTRSRTLENVATFTQGSALWTIGDHLEVVPFSAASPALFDVMRVKPVLGRTFRPKAQQDRPFGDARELVISYALCQRGFGGDPAVVGRSVFIEGRFANRIIGVMPQGFSFPEKTDAWGNRPYMQPVGPNERQMRVGNVVARLAPGATLASSRAELTAVAAQLEIEQPRSNAGWTAGIEPLSAAATGDAKPALLALIGAVAGVLLIGCANVANLLLARATTRRREMAVRVALGAGTARLVRQCLTEALVLAAFGTVTGILLGGWLTGVLVRLAPPGIPHVDDVGMSATLLLFAAAAGLASAVFIGLAPALQVARAERQGGLRVDARAATGRGARVRRLLITSEVAIVVLLLTGAVLLGRSFLNLRGVDLGFESAHVLSIETRWPTGRFATPSRRPWYELQQQVDGLIAAVQSVSGVDAAGLVTNLPLTGDAASGTMWRADAPGASGLKPPASARDQWKADITVVTPGYFAALGVPFLRGRNFVETDRLTQAQLSDPSTPRSPGAAVITSAFASRYFPNEDPIGRTLVLYDDQTFGGTRTVVGIVGDVRGQAVGEAARPTIFLPHAGHPDVFRPTIVIRSTLPPDSIARAIRERIHAFDPELLVLRTRPMGDIVSSALSRPRFNLLLVGSFAAVALGLAAIGIYGVVAFLVTQRTREIGIRMALGARAADVLTLMLREGMAPVLLGGAAGMLAALAATRMLRTMLFGVTPLDPVSFAAAPALLAGVALLACYLPARRALRVDPIVALRDE